MTPADSHSVSPEKIVGAIEAELETLTQVLEMLDIEHEALMGNDAGRLEQAVAAKQNAISAHLQSRSDREALGLCDSLAEQIETHPTLLNGLRERALNIVSELNRLATESKLLNARKGKLIAGLRERTSASIKVLRPEAASISRYGGSGSAENTMGSRLLGSA